MDYVCERGAKRNFEVWRNNDPDANKLETEDERLDRLEAERAEQGGVMEELEAKVHDAKQEMAIADALDEIRTRNARIGRAEGREAEGEALEAAERKRKEIEDEKRRVEEEDAEQARRAFARARGEDIEHQDGSEEVTPQAGGKEDGGEAGGGMYGELYAAQIGDMAPPPKPTPSESKSQSTSQGPPASKAEVPGFKKVVKKKKDFSAALGIKKKPELI